MTITEALSEACRRWDASKPTQWRGSHGQVEYHGAKVFMESEDVAWLGRVEHRVWCTVGYVEAWPGCCMGFMEQGCGRTFEAAFEDADRRQLEHLVAQTPHVQNYGGLKEATDKAIADAGSVTAALVAAKEMTR